MYGILFLFVNNKSLSVSSSFFDLYYFFLRGGQEIYINIGSWLCMITHARPITSLLKIHIDRRNCRHELALFPHNKTIKMMPSPPPHNDQILDKVRQKRQKATKIDKFDLNWGKIDQVWQSSTKDQQNSTTFDQNRQNIDKKSTKNRQSSTSFDKFDIIRRCVRRRVHVEFVEFCRGRVLGGGPLGGTPH